MAQRIFNGMLFKNIRTWNAYIGGLAINGYGKEALKRFEDLVESGARPNEVTFLAVYTACCHNGLVDEGRKAGLVGEAVELIKIFRSQELS
ncbi:hypothetical protein JHK84_056382 [Glycine max]|nr:hypothetical protein JHK84_056382 [Glycine max]